MNKIIKLNQKKSSLNAGFTLLEILVGVLIAFFFVIGSMQALVLATAMRVNAQARQRADQLIQEDIEQVKYEAQELTANHSLCIADDIDTSNDDGTTEDSYAEYLYYDKVAVLPTLSKRLIDGVATSELLTLNRSLDEANSTAKKLRVNYTVTDSDDNSVEPNNINSYIEVIPNAAVQCP